MKSFYVIFSNFKSCVNVVSGNLIKIQIKIHFSFFLLISTSDVYLMALFFFGPLPHDSHFDLFSLCIKSIDLELNRSSEGIKYRNSGVRSGTTKIDVRRSHLISHHFFFWFSAFAIRLQLWPSIVPPRATQLAWSNNKLKDQIAHNGVSMSIASLPPHPPHPPVRICHVDRSAIFHGV